MIDISKMNKADVLAKLYNASMPLGFGHSIYDPADMTLEEAQKILDEKGTRFDYCQGRVMKVDLSDDHMDPWLYDRDNGSGAAARALGVNEQTG